MLTRICKREGCGKELGPLKRANAKFCSHNCYNTYFRKKFIRSRQNFGKHGDTIAEKLNNFLDHFIEQLSNV
jgi:hypothetical protein